MNITIPILERIFINTSFITLLATTFYYWWKIIFQSESPYINRGLVGYTIASFCLTVHLILRWQDSGHFPLSNLYESLIFLAWCLLILHIYLENSIKTFFLGVLTSPALLCLIAFTDFSLPSELQKSNPLVPALQSNWLIMHVTVMIGSYAALLLGCLVAIAYLIFSTVFFTKTSNFIEEKEPLNDLNVLTLQPTFNSKNKESNLIRSASSSSFNTKPTEFLKFLDNLSYRTIGIGFCLLTLGILSGAVWANETWGNYWSWDPKETWAFITWLTFATYLHSRLIIGWAGSKPAWIASFGFIIVWVCYLGVNLLGQGLHSYGFIQI